MHKVEQRDTVRMTHGKCNVYLWEDSAPNARRLNRDCGLIAETFLLAQPPSGPKDHLFKLGPVR